MLGGGRTRKEDDIDHSVGIELVKKISEWVDAGEVIARLYYSSRSDLMAALELVKSAYEFSEQPLKMPPVVLEVIE